MGNTCSHNHKSFEWKDREVCYRTCSFTEPGWFHVVNTIHLSKRKSTSENAVLYTPYEWVIPTSYKPVYWPTQMLRWDYEIKESEFRSIIDKLRMNPEIESTRGIFQFAEWLESWEGKCFKLSRRVCYISSF